MYASARPLALPPDSNSLGGMSTVVTNVVVSRYTLMIAAATVSSLRVLAMRPRRTSSSVRPSELTSGIMLTPVSNPERPRTSSGQGDGDDPRRGDEPQQTQDQDLAAPEGKQPLQHRDRPLPVRTFGSHASVHRQHSEERHGHDQQRCEWR